MSKIDRQLDNVSGEGRVEIHIAEGQQVDVGGLHQMLRNEIDMRQQRIPLDLRGVHGAPPELVAVLIESQKYARSQGKLLAIRYALPAMQDALNPHRGRRSAEPESQPQDAGQVAKTLLDSQLAEEPAYDISRAQKIQRDKSKQKRKRSKIRDYAILLGFAILAVAAIEWILVFNSDSTPMTVPSKSFE
jgi:hypothetical protein